MKVAALGDIHVHETAVNKYKELFRHISGVADVMVLCGDITDLGKPKEAEVLAEELSAFTIPVVGVLGNHDYESGKEKEVKKILSSYMKFLDDEPVEINGIGFVGTKGFGGGFGRYMLSSFGEDAMKKFVRESVGEALHLESLLGRLHTEKKVVALHYSPIVDTVKGEPIDIFPYLGSSRLEDSIDHFDVSLVLHGHAHFGSYAGKTRNGTPVHNVAYPLMQKTKPKESFGLFEV